jgi:hypothetical protein
VSTHTPYAIPFTHTHDYSRPIHTHTNALLTTYTQPQHPLWTPIYGLLVADTGIEQADESPGLTPPRVQGQPKQKNLTDIPRVDIHSHPHYKRRGSAKAHHRHTSTHTRQAVSEGFALANPSQDIHTGTLRTDIHSHPHYKRKGSAKVHHKRHTHTHTRQVVGKGFAFTRPCQN